jgi:hypothetical protein
VVLKIPFWFGVASETSNSGLGDAMDVVSQNLSMSIFTSLAQSPFPPFPRPPIVVVVVRLV